MKNFYWETKGIGNVNLIILNGWGFSTTVWFFIIKELQFYFKFYLIDLPGIGKNKHLYPMKTEKLIKILHSFVPSHSIWLGWSIGGLIASRFALSYPKKVLSIISVTSSPYFIQERTWPGTHYNILHNLYCGLKKNYYNTINNFLDMQVTSSKIYYEDVQILKKKYLSNQHQR